MNDLQRRFNELREFNTKLETSSDTDIMLEKNKMKKDMIELVANQIYDRITKLINNRRKRSGIKGGANIEEPIVNYDSFNPDDNGNLTFVRKNEVINLGNINEGLISPSILIKNLRVNRLKLMDFRNITDEDIDRYRASMRMPEEGQKIK